MNREEIIINEVQDCIKAYRKRPMFHIDGTDCIVLDNDDINRISYRCAFWILIKEKDLLKEFVEWLKAKYENKRKAWYEIAEEKEQTEDEWEKSKAPIYFGRSYGFDCCATDLDQDLENFLKEKQK